MHKPKYKTISSNGQRELEEELNAAAEEGYWLQHWEYTGARFLAVLEFVEPDVEPDPPPEYRCACPAWVRRLCLAVKVLRRG